MDRRSELSEFLRSRRGRISPGEAGVAGHGQRRRVPGLRREELAQLAGVSVDYYVRLEQGRATNVSDQVLDAVARVLKLDADERLHLDRLAKPGREPRRVVPQQQVRPGLQHLLDAMSDVAAYVIGRRTDLLAFNALGAALIPSLQTTPARQRNFARLLFTDLATQSLFVDLRSKARDAVAFLRVAAGRFPDDPALAELIAELDLRSELFRRLWQEHPVRDKGHSLVQVNHPVVGPLSLGYQALRLPDEPDQTLVTYSAAPGSESAGSLRLLASWHLTDKR
ncbi:helix-turn-helix domain-containing protein [Rhizocola hellebori]|nr:helix-turn-helix transcriptional regulator [Rhizocola hellebori]